MKTKYKFGAIFLICFLFGSILGYTIAQSGNTFIISEGIYPRGDYTIWREGSTYFAKDSYGAQPSWSGITNASAVINNALDNGVSVFLTNDEYLVTHTIALNDENELLGEGYDTVIKASDSSSISIAMAVIQNKGRFTSTSIGNNIRIANLRVDGNNASNPVLYEGIAIGYVDGFTIENVWVHNAPEIGISIAVGSGDVINAKSYYNEANGLQLDFGATAKGGVFKVIGGRYHHNVATGITLQASVSTWTDPASFTVMGVEADNNNGGGILASLTTGNVEKAMITANHVHNNGGDGIAVSGANGTESKFCTIFGNTVENNSFSGIKLWATSDITVQGNTIINNDQAGGGANNYQSGIHIMQSYNILIQGNTVTDDQTVKTQRFGIRLSGGSVFSQNITIVYNSVVGNNESNMYFEGTYNLTTIVGNMGFRTENSGNATLSTGNTVTHLLAGTPTSILVTAGESAPTDIYLSAIGASTFTINFGGGGTKNFYWEAKYKP